MKNETDVSAEWARVDYDDLKALAISAVFGKYKQLKDFTLDMEATVDEHFSEMSENDYLNCVTDIKNSARRGTDIVMSLLDLSKTAQAILYMEKGDRTAEIVGRKNDTKEDD